MPVNHKAFLLVPNNRFQVNHSRLLQRTSNAPKSKEIWLKKPTRYAQAQLKRDTDKLFQLSTELKQYVDKTNENVMSFEVI